MGIPCGSIVSVVKPLYGILEAGNHWFKTYHDHHTKNLLIKTSTYDLCLLYSCEPFGVVALQTDDTLFLVDIEFTRQEAL